MNKFDLVFMDLDIFLLLLLSVEVVSLEEILIGVSLMVPSTIRALEEVRARFTLLHFEMRWICLLISLAAPPEFAVVLGLVRVITFDTFSTLNSAWKGHMAPLPAVLALQNTQVYVCATNSCNVLTNVEAPVDEHFGIAATLCILYIYPDNSHVRFRRYLDYPWPWH